MNLNVARDLVMSPPSLGVCRLRGSRLVGCQAPDGCSLWVCWAFEVMGVRFLQDQTGRMGAGVVCPQGLLLAPWGDVGLGSLIRAGLGWAVSGRGWAWPTCFWCSDVLLTVCGGCC